jgi:hypothetical protein
MEINLNLLLSICTIPFTSLGGHRILSYCEDDAADVAALADAIDEKAENCCGFNNKPGKMVAAR